MSRTESIKISLYNITFIIAVCIIWGMLRSSSLLMGSSYLSALDLDVYMVMGRTLLEGGNIYLDTWDHKGPFLYLVFAAAQLITPASSLGIIIIICINKFFVLYYLFRIAKIWLPSSWALGLTMLAPLVFGKWMANPTEFILSLQMVSLYYFLRKFILGDERSLTLLLAICTLISFYVKFNLIVFWAPLLVMESLHQAKSHGARAFVKSILVFVTVALTISGIVCIFFNAEFVLNSYFLFNINYANQAGSIIFNDPVYFISMFLHVINRSESVQALFVYPWLKMLVCALPLVSCFVLWPILYRRNFAVYATLFAAAILQIYASFSGVFAFYHYYFSLYPFYALSGIFWLILMRKVFHKIWHHRYERKLAWLFPVFSLLLSSIVLFKLGKKYNSLPTRDTITALHELQKLNIASGDLLIVDESLSYYTYLNLSPAIGYFYQPAISVRTFPFHEIQEAECIERRAARFILTNVESQKLDHLKSSGYKNTNTLDTTQLILLERIE